MKKFLITISGFFLLTTFAACSSQQENNNAPASPTDNNQESSLTVNPATEKCTSKDPDICKFLNNAIADKSFTVKAKVGSSGASSDVLLEMATNSYHLQLSGGGMTFLDQVKIGDTIYSKDLKDGKWWKYTYKNDTEKAKNPIQPSAFDLSENVKNNAETSEYTTMGKAPCGTFTCFKYQIANSDVKGKAYIYFDDKEYKIRQADIEDTDGTKSTAEYTWGNVIIAAPTDTKDAKSLNQITSLPGLN